jgi:hypothetical protein
MRDTRPVGLLLVLLALTGCTAVNTAADRSTGSPTPVDTAAAVSSGSQGSPADATSAGVESAGAESPGGRPNRADAGPLPDPCSLLDPVDLAGYLRQTPPGEHRDPAAELPTCVWGDGEFRAIGLTVWRPAAAERPPTHDTRPVHGADAVVVEDVEYTCELHWAGDAGAVRLKVVATDQESWCTETTATLDLVLTRLGW